MEGRRQQLQPFTTVKHSKLQQQQDSHSKALEERKQKKERNMLFPMLFVLRKQVVAGAMPVGGIRRYLRENVCLYLHTYVNMVK